jgi:hypothetical protein
MRDQPRGTRSLAFVATLVLVAACGTPGTPVPIRTPGAPGSAPPSTVPSSGASPAAAADVWDLVWFSDSSAAAAADLYAARIQERFGLTVRVHNFWGPGTGGSASFIADLVSVDAVEQAIKEAEVIGLYTNPGRTKAGDAVAEACTEGVKGHPPKTYTAADFKEYADHLRSIYDRFLELRGYGTALAIRAMDLYVPVLASWRVAGVERECTAAWETWTSVSRSVAAEYAVPMVSFYDAFNGPKHDQDPWDKGFIGADGVHPSEAGSSFQAEVLDAAGYDPLKR